MGHVGAGDGVVNLLFHLAPQGADAALGLRQLLFQVAAFHGNEGPALFYIGQAQLTQQVQPGHRPGESKVEALAEAGGNLLRPGMDAVHVIKAQLPTGVFQEVDALIQTVQQGQLHGGAGDLQGKAGEAGAGAHVNDLLAGKIRQAQQGPTVQKMEAGHILLAGDGRQVHDLVHLLQIFIIDAVARQGLGIRHQGKGLKAGMEKRFKHFMHLGQNRSYGRQW